MNTYTIDFELFGKRIETEITAANETEAKTKVFQKIIFHKVEKKEIDLLLIENCANCKHLGQWIGSRLDGEDIHLCNFLGASTSSLSNPCEDYSSAINKEKEG